ncbi:hypothetical protein ACHAW6_005114 [Cyclotella cf. meneghiniana]
MHLPGKINASNLFTKELKDAAHFHSGHNTFMVSKDLPFYAFSARPCPDEDKVHMPSNANAPSGKRPLKRSYLVVMSAAMTISDRPSLSSAERGMMIGSAPLLGTDRPKFGLSF